MSGKPSLFPDEIRQHVRQHLEVSQRDARAKYETAANAAAVEFNAKGLLRSGDLIKRLFAILEDALRGRAVAVADLWIEVLSKAKITVTAEIAAEIRDSWLEPDLFKLRDFAEAIYREYADKIPAHGGPSIQMAVDKAITDGQLRLDDAALFLKPEKEAMKPNTTAPDPHVIWVVHGRNEALRKGIFEFLRALHLRPVEFSEAVNLTGEGSPTIPQILDKAIPTAQAVIVLLSGDDIAYLHPSLQKANDSTDETKPTPQPRQNVLFEAGLCLGRLPNSTIFIQIGRTRPFSNILGRHIVHLTNNATSRNDLVGRLKRAGAAVDTGGNDWLTAGSFDGLPPVDEPSHDAVAAPHHLSPQACELLVAADTAKGEILTINMPRPIGRRVQINKKPYADPTDPAVAAKYLEAFDELIDAGMVLRSDRSDGAIHRLTGSGFELARKLASEQAK